MGHAPEEVGDLYSKLNDDALFRQEWAEQVRRRREEEALRRTRQQLYIHQLFNITFKHMVGGEGFHLRPPGPEPPNEVPQNNLKR
jgi:hypothetical protein